MTHLLRVVTFIVFMFEYKLLIWDDVCVKLILVRSRIVQNAYMWFKGQKLLMSNQNNNYNLALYLQLLM